jgi:uncharacterized protein (DUF58 family)
VKRLVYLLLRAFTSVQQGLRERLTAPGWAVLGAAALGAAAGIDTNQTVTYQAFTFLSALLFIAFLFSLTLRARTEASRELPRYATAGEPLLYSVTISNRGPGRLEDATVTERFVDPRPSFSEWLATREPGERRRNPLDRALGYFRWQWHVQRRLPRRLEEAPLPPLAAGERRTLKMQLTPRRRGRLELESVTVRRADPLGLVRRSSRVPLPGRITALPKRYAIPPIALPGKRKFQQGGVSLASAVGESDEFVGLRDYRPGDPLRNIHWKSFARSGKPVVREYQDEFFERHALVLDTGRAEGEDDVFEEAVAVAASFVYTVDTLECLLDLLFVGKEIHSYTTGRGQASAEHLLEVLAGLAPSSPAQFAEVSRAVRSRGARMSSAILVFVEWDAERRALAESLVASGVEVRAMLVCRQDERPGDVPPWIAVLHPGEIQAGLARLA